MSEDLSPHEVLRRFRPHDGTLTDFVAARTERDPDREAAVFEGLSWSRAALAADSARLAGLLRERGVAKGDRVAIVAPNSIAHILVLLASARLGAVFVPVNPQFGEGEIAYVLGHCRPRLVISAEALAPTIAGAAAAAGLDVPVLTTDIVSAPAEPFSGHDVGAADPCLIIYTSGTTGFPKGAVHSHASLVAAGEAFVERLHLQESDRLLLILPMFHINALFYSVAGAFAAGAVLLVEERFSASRFWERAVELGATQANVIEAVVSILLTRPESEFRPEHRISKMYGVRQAMVDRFRTRFGVENLIGGYGMTEIPGVISTPFGEAAPAGSMGRLCRHPDPDREWASCRIVDEDGRDLPDGETGELWVRTPVMMLGYFEDPAQTEASFRDGWFTTGDLVRRDAEGNFYFVARRKDIIRHRGENVSGAEIDRVVLSHPDVEIAAAIGVPGALGDEDILVVVKPREGAALKEAAIVEHCRERIAAVKVPRYIVFMDDVPMTPTHKVAKRMLKEDAGLLARAVDFG